MTQKSHEMSLDEVLSSIKQMVVDAEPPVVELTEMVSPNGDVISVVEQDADGSHAAAETEMGAFLKLVQENSGTVQDYQDYVVEHADVHDDVAVSKRVPEFVHQIAEKVIREWLDHHLERVVASIAEVEIKKILSVK